MAAGGRTTDNKGKDVTDSQKEQRPFQPSTQHPDADRAAYAAGYSEGYAAGVIAESRLPLALIPAGLGHPAYLNGYDAGKADGVANCREKR